MNHKTIRDSLAAITLVAMAASPVIIAKSAKAGDYQQFESAIRAARWAMHVHSRDCAAGPEVQREICDARAFASWQKAEAQATASYRDTPQAWREASKVARRADARVRRVESGK